MARHYKTFKTVVLLVLLMLILTITVKTRLDMLPQSINAKEFRALLTPYSIDFFSDAEEKLFKISPYDDYIYFGNRKDHIYNYNTVYKVEKDYFSEVFRLWPISQNLVWRLKGERADIAYIVKASDNSVDIVRNFKADSMPTSIGQSIAFCFDCLVSDEYNKIYFNSDQLTQEKLFLAQKLKLTPILINKDQFFPKGVYRIKIISREGRAQFEIYVNDYQEIYYDEKYHLLEFKTYTDRTKPANVSQKIAF